ncbi:MAG: hypothetical protein WC869_01010 [Phycisphaerae bacterium]
MRPNILDHRGSDPYEIRGKNDLLLNPCEYSVRYMTDSGVTFQATDCRLPVVYIYNSPEYRHEFALAVADFFMMFRSRIWPHLNGFPGFANCELREMKGDPP